MPRPPQQLWGPADLLESKIIRTKRRVSRSLPLPRRRRRMMLKMKQKKMPRKMRPQKKSKRPKRK